MAQANFAYDVLHDQAVRSVSVSLFADRPHMRNILHDDAQAAGLLIAECGSLDSLLEGDPKPLPDVVMVDCPRVQAAEMALLNRLDMRAARSGAQLIISTTLDGLDAAFSCLDQSRPQILVDPTRGERVIALGRALAGLANLRVRELSEEDRLMLLRLTEQVDRIAERLEGLEGRPGSADRRAEQVETPSIPFTGKEEGKDESAVFRGPAITLPDPRLLRRILRQRQLRGRFFDPDLFADPAWDILLDLTAAHAEGARVSVTSLCIAAGVPPTTALRWIGQLTQAGLLRRTEDETDRRRAFIALTEKALTGMARYFEQLERETVRVV